MHEDGADDNTDRTERVRQNVKENALHNLAPARSSLLSPMGMSSSVTMSVSLVVAVSMALILISMTVSVAPTSMAMTMSSSSVLRIVKGLLNGFIK